MKLVLILAFVALNSVGGQAQSTWFIGEGSKLFFATRTTTSWDWLEAWDYCHMYNLMPGSIETEHDVEVITKFLNSSSEIPHQTKALWLPASDHRMEGTYQWLWNGEQVSVGRWAPGHPSGNRIKNCMIIDEDGLFYEEFCEETSRSYMILCEAHYFYSGITKEVKIPPPPQQILQEPKLSESKVQQLLSTTQITVIGVVGRKTYFLENQNLYWGEALDNCHAAGLVMASAENPAELAFLENYAREQAQLDPNPIYWLGGSDLLTVSCLKSNSEFRWFHSGATLQNQPEYGHNYRYRCTYLSPSGISTSGCMRGGGIHGKSICQIGF